MIIRVVEDSDAWACMGGVSEQDICSRENACSRSGG